MENAGKPKRSIRQMLGLPMILVVSAAASAGLYAFLRHYDYYFAVSELAQAEAAYKASGLPWTAEGLRPNPPVKAEDNAAPDVFKAIRLLPSGAPSSMSSAADRMRQLRVAKDYQRLLNLINNHQSAIDQVAEAVKKPHFDSNPDWDLGEDLVFPELASMKWFVRQLAYRAEANAGLSRQKEAIQDLEAAWRLAHLIGQEPFTFFITSSNACQAIVLDSLLRCVATGNFDQAALDKLSKMLSSLPEPDLITALRGEIYMGLAVLRNERSIDSFASDSSDGALAKIDNWLDDRISNKTKYKAFRTRYLQANAEIGHLLKHPMEVHELGKSADAIVIRYEEKRGKSHRYVGYGFSLFTSGFLNSRTRRTATLAILQCLRIQSQIGKLPDQIDQIPGTWTDPFSGKPLKLVRKGKDIRIYSIGPDLKDEGGATKAETTFSNDDIVVIYPPLPLKP